jgi:hypothetical protein
LLCIVTSIPSVGVGVVVGTPWLLALLEGSTCPSGEAEYAKGVRHSRAYVAGVERGRNNSR